MVILSRCPAISGRQVSDCGSNRDILSAADYLSSQSREALSIQRFRLDQGGSQLSRTEQGRKTIGWAVSNRLIVAGAPPLGGVALLDPAWDPFIEHPEIAIPFDIELFVGQTGQLVGTRSVEHDDPLARDVPGPGINAVNGNR
jgi:hypothetical protein